MTIKRYARVRNSAFHAALLWTAILSAGDGTAAWSFGEASSSYSVTVALPSTSTGSTTGTLAVHLEFPAKGRYAAGAPVLIWVKGGTDANALDHSLPPGAADLVVITFLFPGGVDPARGARSDGTYDYRGPKCIKALRDVVLYAAGVRRTVENGAPAGFCPPPYVGGYNSR